MGNLRIYDRTVEYKRELRRVARDVKTHSTNQATRTITEVNQHTTQAVGDGGKELQDALVSHEVRCFGEVLSLDA